MFSQMMFFRSRFFVLYLLCTIFSANAQVTESSQQANEAKTISLEAEYVAHEQQQISQLQKHPSTQTANLWRDIRAGSFGFTSNQSIYGGQLINAQGEQGRIIQNHYIVPALAWSVVGVFGLFLIFYLVNGSTKLVKGFSGKTIKRWSDLDRWLHWLMAITCLALMLTGLNIALGRHIFHPWLPSNIWSPMILSSKTLHDWLGLPFIVFWAACIIKWMPMQLFKSYDLKWFLSAGGYVHFASFKGKHPPSGFANGGEKMWFWTLALFGLLIISTGLMLVLPKLDLARNLSIIALIIHGGSAVILIGFTIVHIWMATVLSEGGLESMVSGYCDENWAEQHHSIWYKELKNAKQPTNTG